MLRQATIISSYAKYTEKNIDSQLKSYQSYAPYAKYTQKVRQIRCSKIRILSVKGSSLYIAMFSHSYSVSRKKAHEYKLWANEYSQSLNPHYEHLASYTYN